jgi:hypothetical protein
MVDTPDVLKFAQVGIGLAGTPGQVAGMALTVPIEFMQAGKDRAALAAALSTQNFDTLSQDSSVRRSLAEIERKKQDAIRSSMVSGTAGIVSGLAAMAAVGSWVIPGVNATIAPILTSVVVGGGASVLGGVAASAADKAIFTADRNDAFAIAQIIGEKQKKGQPVSELETFALLASSLPDQQLNALNKRLERMTDGKVTTITKAITDGRSDLLSVLMKEPQTDIDLGADTRLNPVAGTTVAAQFAQMLNNGMNVNFLMRRDWRENIALNMNQAGLGLAVAQGVDVDGAPIPFPGGVEPTAAGGGKGRGGKAA